jgi:hypothetical protein
VESQLDKWINENSELFKESKLNIYDMFYWEQRMGNWGAQFPAELDISIEQFSPFNNRLLITTMLSVDEKFRVFPKYTLYYQIIRKLWEETLQQPIGVESFKNKIKHHIKHIVIHFFAKRLFRNINW